VIPYAADEHQVIVTINDEVVWSRSFADPVDATDESMRVRGLFLQ
jgi:hypothetical protein